MKSWFSSVAKLFWLHFCESKIKNTSQAQNNPEVLSTLGPNLAWTRPELGLNPTQKALPDLQLCARKTSHSVQWRFIKASVDG